MLAIIIGIHYGYFYSAFKNNPPVFMLQYLLYLLPFAIAWLMQWFYFREDRSFFSKSWFWILLFAAPLIFTYRIRFNFHESFIKEWATHDLKYVMATVNYALRALILMLPVVFIWFIKDRIHTGLYGFKSQKNYSVYWLMLACMLPVIIIAANNAGFLAAYPKAGKAAGLERTDSLLKFIWFELVYALDFLSIEFFFRGFLIIAFIKYGGAKAIIPAASFYCCIHLGKPMPEAISSFFGGMLLGIISYNTLSIWGGLLIHIGIAWFMELASIISHHY